MPRYVFTPSAVTATGITQRVQIWDRAVGGRRITDLYSIDGSDNITNGVVNGVLTADASTGAIQVFAGPIDLNTVFVAADGGARVSTVSTRLLQSESRTVKPIVTGSKAANAALTSLIAALVAQGIITDSSS